MWGWTRRPLSFSVLLRFYFFSSKLFRTLLRALKEKEREKKERKATLQMGKKHQRKRQREQSPKDKTRNERQEEEWPNGLQNRKDEKNSW
jgi:hypothetical protein